MRLQKYMADCGVASRRACEQIILAGRVSVNGAVVQKLGTEVDPSADTVSVDGKRLRTQNRKAYYALYKPRGVMCTCADDRGRKTVLDCFAQNDLRLFPVGRLDYDSEGLVIMTNDGEYANKVAHPSNGVSKVYKVTVDKHYGQKLADEVLNGIDIGDDRPAKAQALTFVNRPDGKSVLEITIGEGRNREIKRIMEAQEYRVLRLKRIRIGSLELGDMKPGTYRRLTEAEIEGTLGKR